MAAMVDGFDSLSLTDRDFCYDEVVLSGINLAGVALPEQYSGHATAPRCVTEPPSDGGSAAVGSASQDVCNHKQQAITPGSDDGDSLDLEMDFIPSAPTTMGPPTYRDVMAADNSRTVHGELRGPVSDAAVAVSSSQELVGPATLIPAEPPNSRRNRSSRPPSKTEHGSRRAGLTVDLDSTRPKTNKSKRSQTAPSSGSLSSTSSRGTVDKVEKTPNGNMSVTTSGVGSLTVSVTGNVVINNTIDLRAATGGTTSNSRGPKKKPLTVHPPIPARGSKRRLTAEDIETLSTRLGDQWFNIGLSIGVEKGVLENIRSKYKRDQYEMSRQMFLKWKARYGHKATINYIIDALTDPKFEMHSVAAQLPAD